MYDYLNPFREVGDTIADDLITELHESLPITEFMGIFHALIKGKDDVLSSLDIPILNSYFDKTKALPAWADMHKINKAQHFFGTYGPQIAMVLLFKCLPGSYSAWRGAEVLYLTGRMQAGTRDQLDVLSNRVMETSQFIIDAMAPEGFKTGSSIFAAQKIRLVHAFIRSFIYQKEWDQEKYGVPINQEDLLGTLLSFSVYTLEGLKQSGVSLTYEEEENYHHTWNVIGHFLGIQHDLLEHDVVKAHELGYSIMDKNKGESEAGKALTDSLIKLLEHMIPGTAFDKVPLVLMRHYLGEEIGKMLDIPHWDETYQAYIPKVTQKFIGLHDHLADNSIIMRKVTEKMHGVILQAMINYYNKEKQSSLKIPSYLRQEWGIDSYWEDRAVSPKAFGYRLVIQKEYKDPTT